jgi:hypothetical protein
LRCIKKSGDDNYSLKSWLSTFLTRPMNFFFVFFATTQHLDLDRKGARARVAGSNRCEMADESGLDECGIAQSLE